MISFEKPFGKRSPGTTRERLPAEVITRGTAPRQRQVRPQPYFSQRSVARQAEGLLQHVRRRFLSQETIIDSGTNPEFAGRLRFRSGPEVEV